MEFIEALEQVRKEFPNLRWGQIISNALSLALIKTDIFYVEDAEFTTALEEFGRNIKNMAEK